MLTRLLMLIAVMVMIAAGWAFLVTLVSPPLTLGWRETLEATVRRSARHVAVLGIAGVVVMKEARVVGFHWHDLRHTFASRLVMAGVDLRTVQELVGRGDQQADSTLRILTPPAGAQQGDSLHGVRYAQWRGRDRLPGGRVPPAVRHGDWSGER